MGEANPCGPVFCRRGLCLKVLPLRNWPALLRLVKLAGSPILVRSGELRSGVRWISGPSAAWRLLGNGQFPLSGETRNSIIPLYCIRLGGTDCSRGFPGSWNARHGMGRIPQDMAWRAICSAFYGHLLIAQFLHTNKAAHAAVPDSSVRRPAAWAGPIG
ncbi:MAG: hypothetical protein JWM59_4607 [Verrucomicrobiales bacterium]|nr:hypothetical protein [Verrucomicrobiales bacterium]